jgi:hypothetical protein
MRNGPLIGALVLVCLGAASLAAAGQTPQENTKVTLENKTEGLYTGDLTSQVPKCVKGRDVHVYHDANADGNFTGDFEIGHTRTNKRGEYSVTGNQAPAGDQILAYAYSKTLDDVRCKKGRKIATALSG